MTASLSFPRVGDKQNSSQFEDYLGRLLDERDRIGLTDCIRQIDALMITVEPSHSVAYIAELCVMTPYHISSHSKPKRTTPTSCAST